MRENSFSQDKLFRAKLKRGDKFIAPFYKMMSLNRTF
jgi:hypothetical protein